MYKGSIQHVGLCEGGIEVGTSTGYLCKSRGAVLADPIVFNIQQGDTAVHNKRGAQGQSPVFADSIVRQIDGAAAQLADNLVAGVGACCVLWWD
jgi:hypothetical protein